MSFFFLFVAFLSSFHSRMIGCVVFVHIHNQFCVKSNPRVVKCIIIDYASSKKGYCCYHRLSQKVFLRPWMLRLMKLNPFTNILNFKGKVHLKLSLLNLLSDLLSLLYNDRLILLLVLLIQLLPHLV